MERNKKIVPRLLAGASVSDKKVGDFIKKESESLEITSLEIPRDYLFMKGRNQNDKMAAGTISAGNRSGRKR